MQSRWTSRMGWHIVLALVMLLMQQAGLRHSLQHALRDDGAAGTHTVCVECLAHHAHDNSVAPTVPMLATLTFDHVLIAVTAQPQRDQGVTTAYLARAPPFISA